MGNPFCIAEGLLLIYIVTLEEAKEKALAWTLECMIAHKVDNVIIAGEDVVLMKVIERPKSWPSFTSIY